MQLSETIPPHGGTLVDLAAPPQEREALLKQARASKKLFLDPRECSDLYMLAVGAYSPLRGFMLQEDYRQVVHHMHLADGTLWPLPITLSATEEEAGAFAVGDTVALCHEDGT